MIHLKGRILVVGLFGLLYLTGCATTPELPRFVWPAPPDQPRLEWIGVYYTEGDFAKTGTQKAMVKLLGDNNEVAFKTPFGIASNGAGLVYVSDIHEKNIRIFDFNRKTAELLTKVAVLVTPAGLDVDSQGNLYVADMGLGKILVFAPDRRPLFSFGGDKAIINNPSYIAVREELGRIYVSDSIDNKIVVFDMRGNYLFSFGKRGSGDGEFFVPQGLAFDGRGQLFVADTLNARIQVFDADGHFLYRFGERGDQIAQFENPKDVSFDSEGNLYAVDGRRSNLFVFKPDGTLLLTVGEGRPSASIFGFSAPKSVYVDGNDRIYVAESMGKRFSVWQYMGEKYLSQKPFTKEDKTRLLDYMEKQRPRP
ncbi:NHL repeat domain-containing protein [Desulfuromonas soudanensis]|uniref:NHL repeat domain-containing protein n=1 Tax=Desulfuromonas soudanensis TaxID=1603606 RepID=A0A0M3QGE6_9BACT|nr:6-bladed beta-propeller [Desulfuromonas soudanensis]ALC17683.1 NHL repeat domain-containing protein [Desulfuromonas soudanensis]